MLDTVTNCEFLKIPITFYKFHYYIFHITFLKFLKKNINNSWVIGVDEIASIIFF